MFTPDFYIDSVNNAQKKIVETFVTNETFKKELVELIEAQTKFAKTQAAVSLEIAQSVWKNATEVIYAKKA